LVLNEDLFTYDFRDSNHFNPTIHILSHELAHLWWGGLLKISYLPGSRALIEGLAEYSSLQQLNNFHNKDIIHRFMDENFIVKALYSEEIPINKISDDEKNIRLVYYKTPLILRMLSMNIGTAKFNRLLKLYIENNYNTYVSITDFSNYIQNNMLTLDSNHVNNLFTRNIKYNNNIQNVTISKNDKKYYEIIVELEMSKIYVNEQAEQIKILFSNIEKNDITFLKNNRIILQKEISSQNSAKTIKVLLFEKPDKVILDYKRRYVDNRKDNVFLLD
jgi:aminopeptidase N